MNLAPQSNRLILNPIPFTKKAVKQTDFTNSSRIGAIVGHETQ
ncbi:MAG: hypothetical protein ACRD4J_13245 [Nitrososphaeraceae archaeon]